MKRESWSTGTGRLLMAIAAMSVMAAAQIVGGGGGSGNASKLQGVPVAKTAPSDGTCLVYSSSTGEWQASSCAGTASTAWSAVTSGTNTSAAMVVGSGASLAASGTGTIAATSVPAAGLGSGTIANDTSGNAATATAPAAGRSTGSGNFVLATSPTLITPNLGTPSALNLANATNLPFSALPALPWVCNGAGLGDGLNAIPAGTYSQVNCYNGTGHTVTITGIACYTDTGSSTMDVKDSSGNDLLSGAVSCSDTFAAGAQSSTTTLASGAWMRFTFVADGTTKQTSWVIEGTY